VIASGTRLGSHVVRDALGAGGMGEVYRASDTKLDREVAIKVLPAAFVSDPQRLARFEREAKLLASLNHSNIAHVYGFESVALPDGSNIHFLAMELVPGEDLAERLRRGPVPVDEAIAIARQMAEALEEAHERGIVHRDLKPANVKVTPDGKVKVLDFGLAKAYAGEAASGSSPDLSHSPTLAHAGTEAGLILGTAAYMAPEQARGRPVDKRADIWAFGVVLYEMLAGRPAFRGTDVTETLAAVIRDQPALDALGPTVPAGLRRLLDRCLRKDPRERLRDMGDARHALEDLGAATPAAVTRAGRGSMLPWVLCAVLAFAALAAWSLRSGSAATKAPVRRATIDLPWHSVPNWTDFDAAIAADGSRIAYYGRRRNDNDVDVVVRSLDALEGVPLADGREASGLGFSPDGEWIAILDPHGVRKVSVHGGRDQLLARIADGTGLSWGADGALLVGHSSGLVRASSAGGAAEPLTRVDAAAGETGHVSPAHLPGGRHALLTIERGAEGSRLAVVELASRTVRSLGLVGDRPVFAAPGHLVFRQGGSVLAVAFDARTAEVLGDPVPVLEHVRRGPYVAADGTMLYVPERGDSNARLVWVDRTGLPHPIHGERLGYSHIALDATGKQALLNISPDVHVRDLESGTRRLLATGGVSFPIWSRDGRFAAYTSFASDTSTIIRQAADDSAPPEKLVTHTRTLVATSWNSRTGELAYFDEGSDVWILPPGGTARRLLATRFNERSGRFSPDGRWLAYVSDETGRFQVYVVPYPGPGPKLAVSVEGGLEPIWSSDGQELFFRRGGRVLASRLTATPALAATPPVELFDGPYTLDLMGHQRWDVAPDGRFLMVEDSDDFRIVLVQGWREELARLVPTTTKR
jgi:hypothetical protein